MEIEKQKEFIIRVVFISTVIGLIFIALKLLSGVLFPFAVAVMLTVLLQDFIRKWSKKLKLKKKATSVAVVILIYILIGALIFGIIYVLYHQLVELINSFPEYSTQIYNAFSTLTNRLKGIIGKASESSMQMFDGFSDAALQSFTEKITGYLANVAASITKSLPYVLLSIAVMIISSAYFAKDYDEISRFIVRHIPKNASKMIIKFKRSALQNLFNMLRGYFIIMSLTFGEVFVGLVFLKVRYSVVIAALTAVVDILPVLGSGTVLIPWALFCILVGNIPRAIGLIILYVVITCIRNVIEPKIIGEKVGLHPLVMLSAVFIGLKLFGSAGILLMPIAIIIFKSVYESCRS